MHEFERTAEKFKQELQNITNDFKLRQAELKQKEDTKPLLTKEVTELKNRLDQKTNELHALEREIPILKEKLRHDEREITVKQTELQKIAREQAEAMKQSGINIPKS